ncbi:MAG: hypothetical protein LBT67_01880 [Holosporaceae bacterium]|nr:hypothetical protein [Holosporaceae bacterium]
MRIFTKIVALMSVVGCFGLAFCDVETTTPEQTTDVDAVTTTQQTPETTPDFAVEPASTEDQQ